MSQNTPPIKEFAAQVASGSNPLVIALHNTFLTPAQKQKAHTDLNKQAQTVEADFQKTATGQMSYSDFRSRYG